jgi:hypothetical protein
MGWKHLTIAIEDDYERIRDGVELLLARAADMDDVALFTRTSADRRHRVLLLSPHAVELAGEVLSGRWVDCDEPELFQWDLVVGDAGAGEKLRLARPCFGRREKSPIIVIGGKPPPPNGPDTTTAGDAA